MNVTINCAKFSTSGLPRWMVFKEDVDLSTYDPAKLTAFDFTLREPTVLTLIQAADSAADMLIRANSTGATAPVSQEMAYQITFLQKLATAIKGPEVDFVVAHGGCLTEAQAEQIPPPVRAALVARADPNRCYANSEDLQSLKKPVPGQDTPAQDTDKHD